MTALASLVLFSRAPAATAAFYRTLGIDLADEDHGDGVVHYAADLGGVHVAVFDAPQQPAVVPGYRQAGTVFPGFWVADLDDTVAALRAQGTSTVVDHQVREWGCRIIVADPDGRAVEVNQRGHCAVED
jgi:lactoylglutathione lyase